MSEKPKILIVGGGTLTSAMADALATFDRRGVDVVVVEEASNPTTALPSRITERDLMDLIAPSDFVERRVRTHPTSPRKERRK